MVTTCLAEGNPKRTSLRIHSARRGASASVAEAWEPTVHHIGPLSDQPGGVHILPGLPRGVFDAIALPFDLVLEATPEQSTVQDGLHFVLLVLTNDNWWRRGVWVATWNWICWGQGQLDYIEDQVELAHPYW